VQWRAHAEPLEAYHLTWWHTAHAFLPHCGGDRGVAIARAKGAIEGESRGRELYKLAAKVGSYNLARARNVPSVDPQEVMAWRGWDWTVDEKGNVDVE
jgi:hypothetical protein